MAADLAELGLIVTSAPAVRSLATFDSAASKSVIAADNLTERLKRQSQEFERLARSGLLVPAGYRQMETATRSMVAAKSDAIRVSDKLRGGLTSLAVAATGTNPMIGRLATTLSAFAVGGAVTAGVVGGIAAIGVAYNKLTEDTRRLKEETKAAQERIEALRKQQAGPDAQNNADVKTLTASRDRLQKELDRKERAQAGSPFREDLSAQRRDLAKFNSDIEVLTRDSALRQQEFKQKLDNEYYGKAVEDQRALDAETRRLNKEAHDLRMRQIDEEVARLSRLGRVDLDALLGNIDARIGASPFGGAALTPWAQQASDEAVRKAREDAASDEVRRNNTLNDAFNKATPAINGLTRSAQSASYALEQMLIQKFGGGIGAGLGAGAARGAFDDAVLKGVFGKSFATTALGGAVFGPILAGAGAAIGAGFDAFISDVFGGAARRRAAEVFQQAVQNFAASLASERARLSGNTLQADIIDTQIEFSKRREEAKRFTPIHAPDFADSRKRQEAARAQALAELNQLEEQRIAHLKEEARIRKQQAEVDFRARTLIAQGNDEQAAAIRQQIADERELAEARKLGIDDAIVRETHRAEAEKRAADAAKRRDEEAKRAAEETLRAITEMARKANELARADASLRSSTVGRGLSALGLGREADEARFAASARQEMEEAIRSGMSPQTLAMLAFVQVLERDQMRAQRQIDEQTKAINAAADAQIKALEEQEKSARAQLDIARENLRNQERSAEETRRVFESLSQFRSGLGLNTSLTTLSPINQLGEARRQYESLLGLASGGDRNAAGRLPDAARGFLDASRAVNASGMGYVSDFDRVQSTLAMVTDRFGAQLTVEERMLRELEIQSKTLDEQVKALEAAKEEARASADRQIVELVKQVTEAQKASAMSIGFYGDFRRAADEQLANDIRYFADMVKHLSDGIGYWQRIATGWEDFRGGWEVITRPGGGPLEVPLANLITEVKALLNVTVATAQQARADAQLVREALIENTTVTKQGLEGAKLS